MVQLNINIENKDEEVSLFVDFDYQIIFTQKKTNSTHPYHFSSIMEILWLPLNDKITQSMSLKLSK